MTRATTTGCIVEHGAPAAASRQIDKKFPFAVEKGSCLSGDRSENGSTMKEEE